MLRDFLVEFKNGIYDSIQGFLVVTKLDKPPKNAVTSQQRESSAEPSTNKPTILEKRRMQQKKQDKKAIPSSVPIQNKVSALTRIFWIVVANFGIIIGIHILFKLIEWLVPNKNSGLYTFGSYFHVMLILPIFMFIRVVSTLWFADVANAAYRYCGATSRSSASVDISRAASDFLHSLVVEFVFLLQTICFAVLPELLFASPIISYLGWLASLVYMSLLHSLYSFEYKWLAGGVFMNTRLLHIEKHWPYHLGFGTLLTILTSLSDSFFLNSCVFGALFPFFIISSFLVETDFPETKVNQISFFYPSQLITNKISLAVFRLFRPSPEIAQSR
ncbi:Etoposide-induced protein 2.4-like protein [Aphelenchoides bicaudatus]|nr:Etoposide-induced protein 2.4-like protein [Aphelenchoides bicaudatus]